MNAKYLPFTDEESDYQSGEVIFAEVFPLQVTDYTDNSVSRAHAFPMAWFWPCKFQFTLHSEGAVNVSGHSGPADKQTQTLNKSFF